MYLEWKAKVTLDTQILSSGPTLATKGQHFLHPTLLAHAHTVTTCFAVPNLCLSLNPLLGTQSCTLTPHHSHLRSLKFPLIFLSCRPGLISMQRTTLHTTAVLSPSHIQRYILISKQ